MSSTHTPGFTPRSVPFGLRWRDPAGHIELEIRLRVLRDLDAIASLSRSSITAVLLGSRGRADRPGSVEDQLVSVLDIHVFPVGGTPAPTRDREFAASRDASAIPVGLVLLSYDEFAPSLSDQLRSFRRMFPNIVDIPVIAFKSRRPERTVSLYLWSGAGGNSLQPTSLEFPLECDALAATQYTPFTPEFFTNATPKADSGKIADGVTPDAQMQPLRNQNIQQAQRPLMEEYPVSRRAGVVIPAWMLGVAAVITASGILAVVYSNQRVPGLSKTSTEVFSRERTRELELDVTRSGTDLRIRWDRNSPVIQNARYGQLQVADAGERLVILLDEKQLLLGQVLYVPKSGDVNVTLEVGGDTGKFTDSVRVIQSSPSRAAPERQQSSYDRQSYLNFPTNDHWDNGRASAPVPSQTARSVIPPTAPPARSSFVPKPVNSSQIPKPDMAVTAPSLPPSLLAGSRPASTIDTPSFVPAPSLGQPSGVPTSKIQASGERNLRASSAQNPGTSETAVSDQSNAPGSATPPKITGPELLKMERPALTPALRAMIKPGFTVAVTVRIDANGKVVGVRQEGQQSGGVAYAVSHAVAAVHRWRFKPATRNGVPIQSEATVHLKF